MYYIYILFQRYFLTEKVSVIDFGTMIFVEFLGFFTALAASEAKVAAVFFGGPFDGLLEFQKLTTAPLLAQLQTRLLAFMAILLRSMQLHFRASHSPSQTKTTSRSLCSTIPLSLPRSQTKTNPLEKTP